MALAKEKTVELASQFGKSDKDSGTAEVQVAIYTTRIAELTEHLKKNKKDFACQRGLMMLVGKRRRMMNFIKKNRTPEQYAELLKTLNLRK